jgi:hypothetical protein
MVHLPVGDRVVPPPDRGRRTGVHQGRRSVPDPGCRVTGWSDDLRPESALEFSKKMSGVDDRAERNRRTISGTLERLAAALEA